MAMCFELGKLESDLPPDFSVDDLYRWHAFFRLKNQAEKRAIDNARRQNGYGGGFRGGVETIIE